MGPRPFPLSLDLEVLAHLRSFPEELERSANLVEHAHPRGLSACALIIQRSGPSGFLRTLCQLVARGESVVTTWEPARQSGWSTAELMQALDRGELSSPEFRYGTKAVWRRQAVEAWLRGVQGAP
ncbi:MAG: hypothetical protein RMM30_08465 [Armatimonadota bacterium]|nr:hypothetical protein [Armatimonadota bacterium]MDW8156600.1 hypothetical protein [Armatimonadota bacterium]